MKNENIKHIIVNFELLRKILKDDVILILESYQKLDGSIKCLDSINGFVELETSNNFYIHESFVINNKDETECLQ